MSYIPAHVLMPYVAATDLRTWANMAQVSREYRTAAKDPYIEHIAVSSALSPYPTFVKELVARGAMLRTQQDGPPKDAPLAGALRGMRAHVLLRLLAHINSMHCLTPKKAEEGLLPLLDIHNRLLIDEAYSRNGLAPVRAIYALISLFTFAQEKECGWPRPELWVYYAVLVFASHCSMWTPKILRNPACALRKVRDAIRDRAYHVKEIGFGRSQLPPWPAFLLRKLVARILNDGLHP